MFLQELEEAGDHAAAQKMYTACLEARDQSLMTPAISKGCKAGLARCAVHQGDVKRGVALARASQDPAVCCQCARVLQDMNQLQVRLGAVRSVASLHKAAAASLVAWANFALVFQACFCRLRCKLILIKAATMALPACTSGTKGT